MAEEEFQESEILFRDSLDFDGHDNLPTNSGREEKKIVAVNKEKSVSIDIPNLSSSRNAHYSGNDETEFVPPHVIIGRRVAALCIGHGRRSTLKGRHLSEFRNAILRMTGFIET
ncbi:Protein of unknown function- DUF584 [Striga hermonthica]|uniref:Uncharacterized protein n=1 Tax=Striga hermonthica TaxID=68872 RepID=A0A9N7NEW9_STRHE|nr:Protein of unknown function- DUF584 [Striga hermonthica]